MFYIGTTVHFTLLYSVVDKGLYTHPQNVYHNKVKAKADKGLLLHVCIWPKRTMYDSQLTCTFKFVNML